jgi:hypothetical protein
MSKANYKVIVDQSDLMVIKDLGPWDQYMTVTNDAENVVKELSEKYGLANKTLLYYDSEGLLSELTHDEGEFTGFSPHGD